jgi:hypothetical protein
MEFGILHYSSSSFGSSEVEFGINLARAVTEKQDKPVPVLRGSPRFRLTFEKRVHIHTAEVCQTVTLPIGLWPAK